MLPDGSEIRFVSTQMGVPVEGRFTRWQAQLSFDPRQPQAAQVGFSIDTRSIAFGAADTEAEAAKPLWFDSARHPQAKFRSSAVEALGGGRYEVAGALTIKGRSHPLRVPVDLVNGPGAGPGPGQRQLHPGAHGLPARRRRVVRRLGGGQRGPGALQAAAGRAGRAVNPPSAAGLLLAAATAAAPGAAAPVDYVLTPTHSFVHFEWDHAGLSTLRGCFDKASGRVTLDRAGRQGKGLVEVRLDSVNTGRPAPDQALRQALGGEGHALGRFEITAPGFDGDRPVSAPGRLSWRDQVLEHRLHAVHFNCYFHALLRREVCGGEFSATLETQALGLRLDSAFALGHKVVLRVQVEAIRQEPTP